MNNLLLFAVGSEYVDLLVDYKKYIPSKFNIVVYTTNINKIKQHLPTAKVLEYKSDVFFYFDKFKYSIQMSNKLKKSVLYVDVGRLCETPDYIWNIELDKVKNICFSATWGELDTAGKLYDFKSSLFEDGYWNDLLDHFKNKVDLSKVNLFLERVLIVPYKKSMELVLSELEDIREMFETLSRRKVNVYRGIGNGEGLGMGYVLTKINEPFDLIEKYINKNTI